MISPLARQALASRCCQSRPQHTHITYASAPVLLLVLSALLTALPQISCAKTPYTAANLRSNSARHLQNPNAAQQPTKCQFKLTNASQSLEVHSSQYEHQGYNWCEYIISAPQAHQVIQLIFSNIHSRRSADMPVVSHHQPQLATTTTTTTTPALSTSSPPPSFSTLSSEADSGKSNNGSSIAPTESSESSNSSPLVISPVSSSSSSQSSDSRKSSEEENSLSGSPSKVNLKTKAPSGHRTKEGNHNKHSPAVQKDSASTAQHTEPKHPHHHHHHQITLITTTTSSEFRDNDDTIANAVNPTASNSHTQVSSSEPPRPALSDSEGDFKDLLDSLLVFYPNRTNGHSRNVSCNTKNFRSASESSGPVGHPILVIESINASDNSQPQVICWQGIPDPKSLVYQYSVPIRVSFFWPTHSDSGFSLDYDFFKVQDVECSLKCNTHLCLRSDQICDGIADCPGQADENNTACALRQETAASGETVKIAIVLSVVLALAVIVLVALMIRHTRSQNGVRLSGDTLLQPSQNQRVEACRSGSLQDSSDQQVALLQGRNNHVPDHQHLEQHQSTRGGNPSRQMAPGQSGSFQCAVDMSGRLSVGNGNTLGVGGLSMAQQHAQQQARQQDQHRLKPVVGVQRKANTEMYPPHIPLSRDGEEGYARAQQALHSKHQRHQNWLVEHEVFRPPPNKTIHERNSPPPPYSLISPGTKSLDSLVPPGGGWSAPSIGSQLSPPVVLRCYSMSCPRQPSILPGAQRSTTMVNSQPPPEYHHVVPQTVVSHSPGSTNTQSAHFSSVGMGNSVSSQADAARARPSGIRTTGSGSASTSLPLGASGTTVMVTQPNVGQGHCVRSPVASASSSVQFPSSSSPPSSSTPSNTVAFQSSCVGPNISIAPIDRSRSQDDKAARRSSSWPQAAPAPSPKPHPQLLQPSSNVKPIVGAPCAVTSTPCTMVATTSTIPVPTVVAAPAIPCGAGLASPSHLVTLGRVTSQSACEPICVSVESGLRKTTQGMEGWESAVKHEPARPCQPEVDPELSSSVSGDGHHVTPVSRANSDVLLLQCDKGFQSVSCSSIVSQDSDSSKLFSSTSNRLPSLAPSSRIVGGKGLANYVAKVATQVAANIEEERDSALGILSAENNSACSTSPRQVNSIQSGVRPEKSFTITTTEQSRAHCSGNNSLASGEGGGNVHFGAIYNTTLSNNGGEGHCNSKAADLSLQSLLTPSRNGKPPS